MKAGGKTERKKRIKNCQRALADGELNWEKFARSAPYWAVLTSQEYLNNKKIKKFYATGKSDFAKIVSSVVKLGGWGKTTLALDFGCGVGRVSFAMANYFKRVVGVDIAPTMIKIARSRRGGVKNIDFRVNKTEKFGFLASCSVDLVYSNITLQHIRPVLIKKYLSEFQRVARKGGLIIFQLPTRRIYNSRFKKLIGLIKSLIPLSIIYAVKTTGGKPYMELYGVPSKKVIKMFPSSRFRLLKVEPNDFAGDKWKSNTYFFRKV